MRLSRTVVFACLAIFLTMSAAYADGQGRNFGSTNCRETFNCGDAGSIDLASMAKSCMANGLGLSTDFTGSSLDENNCLSAVSSGGGSSSISCCLIPVQDQDGICKLGCSVVVR
jgi:hypothetical protein